jgi:AcrR family transcriptional regulator
MRLKRNRAAGEKVGDATRGQLLAAAGEVFAEVGFRSATIRQICERARANVAAVHYHFGDKEGLYREVLRSSQDRAWELHPSQLERSETLAPGARLEAFVRSFLLRIFAPGPAAWHGRLMSREMIEPTGVLKELIEERIRPEAQRLQKVLGELLGANPRSPLVRRCMNSVVSQCLFYHHCRPVIEQLFPDQEFTPEAVEELVQHITRFSLAALRGLATARKAR